MLIAVLWQAMIKVTINKEREHPLEYCFVLSGVVETQQMSQESFMTCSAGKYFFAGSGVAPKKIGELSAQKPHLSSCAKLNIHCHCEWSVAE